MHSTLHTAWTPFRRAGLPFALTFARCSQWRRGSLSHRLSSDCLGNIAHVLYTHQEAGITLRIQHNWQWEFLSSTLYWAVTLQYFAFYSLLPRCIICVPHPRSLMYVPNPSCYILMACILCVCITVIKYSYFTSPLVMTNKFNLSLMAARLC